MHWLMVKRFRLKGVISGCPKAASGVTAMGMSGMCPSKLWCAGFRYLALYAPAWISSLYHHSRLVVVEDMAGGFAEDEGGDDNDKRIVKKEVYYARI